MQRLLMAAALAAVFACSHGAPPRGVGDDLPRINARADAQAAQLVDAAVVDATPRDATPDAALPNASLGKHGDVCAISPAHQGERTHVYECGPGLDCCYPCGIAGCNNVCMTPAECSAPRP